MNYFTKLLLVLSISLPFISTLSAQVNLQKRGIVEIEKKGLVIDGPSDWVNIKLGVGDLGLKETTFYLYHPANTIIIDSVITAHPELTDSLTWTQQIKEYWDANYSINKDWVETRIHWKAKVEVPEFFYQTFLRLKIRAPKGIQGDLATLIMPATIGNNQFVGKDGITYYPISNGAFFPLLRKEVLIFTLKDTVVTPGSRFCRNLTLLQNVAYLISTQMDFAWDPHKIRLDTILRKELPLGTNANFLSNFSFISRAQTTGNLRISWTITDYRDSTTMIQPKAEQNLFALCFTALDTTGNTEFRVNQDQLVEVYSRELQEIKATFLSNTLQVSQKPELWPGDTNEDGVVSHFDFLPIGLGYNRIGPARNGEENIIWNKTIGFDWISNTPGTQVDLKNVDTDGNGIIDDLDANLISRFWNNRVQPGIQNTPEIRSTGAPLVISAQEIFASKPTALAINFGKEQVKAENVYGLAFAIEYDPVKINAEKIVFTPSKSWLGDPNSDLIYFQYNDAETGKLYLALSRVDGQARSGFGPIGELMLQANATAGDKTNTELRISETLAIDPLQNPQGLTAEKTALEVSTTVKTQEPQWAQYLRVTPTLTKGEIVLQTTQNLQIQSLDCVDAQGRVLFSKKGTTSSNLDLSNYHNGMYILRIQTNEGMLSKRIILQK